MRTGSESGADLKACPRIIDKPPLPNVWLGVSAESQEWCNARWSILAQIPAAVRWLSLEPLLGPVNLEKVLEGAVDWVVVGESGPGARLMNPNWARKIRDECANYGVPFCFKQWGQWGPVDHLTFSFSGHEWRQPTLTDFVVRFKSRKQAGRELDGVTHDAYPAIAKGVEIV